MDTHAEMLKFRPFQVQKHLGFGAAQRNEIGKLTVREKPCSSCQGFQFREVDTRTICCFVSPPSAYFDMERFQLGADRLSEEREEIVVEFVSRVNPKCFESFLGGAFQQLQTAIVNS